jgi:hypothetical protein
MVNNSLKNNCSIKTGSARKKIQCVVGNINRKQISGTVLLLLVEKANTCRNKS